VARVSDAQRTKTQNNPLVLGTFDDLSLRYLTGTLGPKNQLVGFADTSTTSNGGFGGGTYNHWFQINIAKPAWIIVCKGGPRPQYIQTSFYALGFTPIEGRNIFDADSISADEVYYPYLDQVMAAGSDLYNTFSRYRLDRGDERYYPLSEGSYLLCVSSTRNELLEYAVGVIIEFPAFEGFFELEDSDGSVFLTETEIDEARTIVINSPVTVDTIISADPIKPNGFSLLSCTINAGVTVTILENSTWFIGPFSSRPTGPDVESDKIILEVGDPLYWDSIHDHSLSEWQTAWSASHQDTDKFPPLFVPLTNRP
jgi:hypothetical protein